MPGNDLTLETPSGVCTRSLVTAILESRRAYQLAMALAKQVLLAGPNFQLEEQSSVEVPTTPDFSGPRRAERTRQTNKRFAMHRRTPRHGLRLVLPNHFDSPLVMPADSSYNSAGNRDCDEPDDRDQSGEDQLRVSRKAPENEK